MTPSRLSLQSLPWNIIQATINVLMYGDQLGQNSVKLEEIKFSNPCIPLLGVSRSWRALALKVLCQECFINLDKKPKSATTEFAIWPAPMKHEHSDFYSLVTSITINTKTQDVFNRKALHQLHSLKLAKGSFDSVKVLKVMLNESLKTTDTRIKAKNAIDFARQVRQLMPHLSSIRVEYSGGEEILESMAWAYELLLGQLYGGLEARELTFVNCGLSLGTVPSTELKLTRIETIWDATFDETIELVRLNANTLRTLEMSCAQPTKLFKLLESRDNSGCVVYPNMRVLHLWSGNFTKYKCQSFKGNYSPFPQLEQLTMDLIYPFTDDVLFRGNTATLNYLRMAADPDTIQLLNSCNVFDGGRMESLRHVRVDVTCVAGISEMETSKLVADFIMSLAFRAQTLEIEGRLPKDAFLGAISQPENCQYLQHLLVNDLQLSLSDILTAIQSAPVLCYLHSQFIGLGDDLKGLPADQVMEHVEVKLKNASRHFKHWRLWHTPSTVIESAAQSVMTLASIFPKFTYSIVTSTVRAEYNSCIRKALTTPPFNNHKAALERLLFVGWD